MFAAVNKWGRFLCGAALSACALAQTADQIERSQRAKDFMAQGRFADAIPLYKDLVSQLPSNSGLLLNLAMAEAMGGHPADAIPHCRRVLEQDAANVPALNMLAMAHLQLNQPAQAVSPLKKLIGLTPGNVDARGMLAGAYMSLGEFGAAAGQYTKLTALAPGDAKGWYGLGKAYESLADQQFQKLVKMAPQSAYVAVLLGESRVQQRQFRSAFFFYRQAERQMPALSGVGSGLASVYRNTGHDDWAAEVEKRDKLPCPSADKSAQCRFAAGHYAELAGSAASDAAALYWSTRAANQLALQAFRKLGELPESTELHALKAQMLHDRKQDLEAAKEWEAAVALAPVDQRPRLEGELAQAWFAARDYGKAIPALQKLAAADPSSADLQFMLGESLWRTQRGDEASGYLRRAIELRPDMLPAHADLGLALLQANKPAEAVEHLEKAQSLDDDGSLHYSLARAYQASGNAEGARKSMETYREIQKRNNDANGELAKEAEITAPSSPPPHAP